MTAPISASGASSASNQNQNLAIIRAYIKQLSQQISNTGLDKKTEETLKKALTSIDKLTSSKSVNDLTSASKQLASTLDHLGNIDPEFIAEQLEDLKSHKGKKDKVSTQITAIHQAVAIYFQTVAPQQSQQSFSFDQGGSRPKGIEALKKDPLGLLPPELINGANEGELGPVTGMAIALEHFFHLNSSSGSSPSIEGSLLDTIGNFSTEEIEELIKAILQNGFRDINEVIGLLAIIGEHGPGINPELLELLAAKIVDFIETEASKATSIVEFMSFLDELAAFMTTDVGMDLFDGLDLEGTLSDMMQNQDESETNSSSINAMANALGIQNIAGINDGSALGDNNGNAQGNELPQLADLANMMEQNPFKLDRRVNSLDKSELGQSDSSQRSPLSKVEKTMESFLNHKKSEFTIQALSIFENYIEKNLDEKMNDFDIEDFDLDLFDSSSTDITPFMDTNPSTLGFS